MKLVTFTCDGPECQQTISEHGIRHWLSIFTKSEEPSLEVRNGVEDHRLETLRRYRDIHFCSRKCFINYFFKEEDADAGT